MKLAIFLILIVIVFGLLITLPTIDLNVDDVVASNAFAYIRAALYFIPLDTFLLIGTLTIGLWSFRVISAVVKIIWQWIPVA